MRKMIIAGNWKMNKDPKEAVEFVSQIKNQIDIDESDVVLCVPFVDLVPVVDCLKDTNIKVGAQNVFYENSGAYTGEISADMLKQAGASYVIIGHSERRALFGETDSVVNKKILKALDSGLKPILCVGETLEQRQNNVTFELIGMQIKNALIGVSSDDAKNIVIAYEPIWAIGTGKTATSFQAQEVCCHIRKVLAQIYSQDVADSVRIQYGGSVNAKNATELFGMLDIDGGLVGGASLKEDFISIVNYK